MGGVAGDAPVPLARLLGMGFRTLVDDLHERLVEQGWTDVRESYGFVLLALRDGPFTTTELAEQLGVSKQAVSKTLEGMEGGGYVRRDADGRDARVKAVSLTDRGRRLLDVVEEIYAQLESEWAAAIGPVALGRMRSSLDKAVRARHDGDLPRLRPT